MVMMIPDISSSLVPQKRRSYAKFHVGNAFEVASAILVCTAVGFLLPWYWALIPGGAFLLVGAEFLYDETVLRIPIPHIPHPLKKIHLISGAKSIINDIKRRIVHLRALVAVDWRLIRKGVRP